MATHTASARGAYGWLLDEFVRATASARHALALAPDGSLIAASGTLDDDAMGRLAEVIFHTERTTELTAPWLATQPMAWCLVTEDGSSVLVTPIATAGALIVVTEPARDPGLICYEAIGVAARLANALRAATPPALTAHRGTPAY